MKKHVKGIGGALLSLAFVLGVLAVAGNTAQAQYRDYGRYQRDNDRYQREQREREREWRRQQAELRRNRQYNNRGYNNGTYGGYGNSGYQYEIQRGYQQGINTGATD